MEEQELSATLIFPHHLFLDHPYLSKDNKVFLIEDQLFFGDYKYKTNFHQKKLILHRASMQYYYEYLLSQGYDVEYVDYLKDPTMDYIFNKLEMERIKIIKCAEIIDYALKNRLKNHADEKNIKFQEKEGPGFLTPIHWINDYYKNKKRYFLTSFYIQQRKRLNILLKKGKPLGGKWGYDKQNRKKIPPGTEIPELTHLKKNKYVLEAIIYVEKHFSDNPGLSEGFFYPVTHDDAQKWFSDFVKNRLALFGDYEDAILEDEPFLFHSVISSSLNVGLITPEQIIEEVLKAPEIPLNSVEGFIRQIIGWREFLRVIYIREGLKQRTTNYLQQHAKMNDKLYYGRTGVKPYDVVVSRVFKHAFAHHIERLMVLGNFMLLVGLDPDEIYKWFMEMFIDSYDWVMVPNIYGMSQYADGGLITTKPYFSSSNYILKMSNFKRGDWCEIWDALFWAFMEKNQDKIGKNPRLTALFRHLHNKKKMQKHKKNSAKFLDNLF